MTEVQIFWSADWQAKIDEERAKADAFRRLAEIDYEAEKARILAGCGAAPPVEGWFKHHYGEGYSP